MLFSIKKASGSQLQICSDCCRHLEEQIIIYKVKGNMSQATLNTGLLASRTWFLPTIICFLQWMSGCHFGCYFL